MNSELPHLVGLAVQDLKRELQELYGHRLKSVMLYGSYARGDFHDASDIDVLVVLSGAVNTSDEISRISFLASEVCLRHNVLISILPVSQGWIVAHPGPFSENIRREAVRL